MGEILLVVLLSSIIAAMIVPRFFNVATDARYEACRTNVANINALVQLYYIREATWPNLEMTNIETNVNYFPEESLPDCPNPPVQARRFRSGPKGC